MFYFLGKVCLQLREYTSMNPQPCPAHITPAQLWARMQNIQSQNKELILTRQNSF